VNGAVSGDSTTVFASLKESLKDGQQKWNVILPCWWAHGKASARWWLSDRNNNAIRAGTQAAATDATSPDEVTMHAASLINGVSGIARMFGYPLPMVPETLRSQAQESVKLLKQ
jgi:hypothetical protein